MYKVQDYTGSADTFEEGKIYQEVNPKYFAVSDHGADDTFVFRELEPTETHRYKEHEKFLITDMNDKTYTEHLCILLFHFDSFSNAETAIRGYQKAIISARKMIEEVEVKKV